jgi:hypothetical protein
VTPSVKLIICLIFISSSSIASYVVAIARPRDFAVLRKSRFRSLFRDGRLNSSGVSILSPSSKIFERVIDLNRVIGDHTIGSTLDILWSAKDRFHVA